MMIKVEIKEMLKNGDFCYYSGDGYRLMMCRYFDCELKDILQTICKVLDCEIVSTPADIFANISAGKAYNITFNKLEITISLVKPSDLLMFRNDLAKVDWLR